MDERRQEHAYLEGRPISAREAERRYGVPFKTVLRWAEAGLIRYLPGGREGKACKLNEAVWTLPRTQDQEIDWLKAGPRLDHKNGGPLRGPRFIVRFFCIAS
jgi:transposase